MFEWLTLPAREVPVWFLLTGMAVAGCLGWLSAWLFECSFRALLGRISRKKEVPYA